MYTVLTPFLNCALEQELGRLGVEVQRWFPVRLRMPKPALPWRLRRDRQARAARAGSPYLSRGVGGFARPAIGEAALMAQGEVDGLVHVAPFNCTPEIVAQSALVALQRDRGIPVLNLSFDEQTAKAGVSTRLEAFVDMICGRESADGSSDVRVGVPRALSYCRDFMPWKTFLETLGAEVVVSPPTTRTTLEAGLTYTIPESCLPLKVFCGQVRALVGQCDALLVPSVRRYTAGSTNYAELIGLPDVLRAVMDDLPLVIAAEVDLSGGLRSFAGLAVQVGTEFTFSPLLVHEAAAAAMAHKQQIGHAVDEILYGLCQALVRNYLSNLALGRTLHEPVVFQGGVAANAGVVRAFGEALSADIIVPPHHYLMGALGAALLAQESMDGRATAFRRL